MNNDVKSIESPQWCEKYKRRTLWSRQCVFRKDTESGLLWKEICLFRNQSVNMCMSTCLHDRAVPFSNWQSGEPSNSDQECCVEIRASHTWEWNNKECDARRTVLCKIPLWIMMWSPLNHHNDVKSTNGELFDQGNVCFVKIQNLDSCEKNYVYSETSQ